ncbi:endolytic transglycosylase MltG [Pseudomonas sp. KNUC1026]|uniref:endolytic transglycosylase MltG n=1 Tax=Pseudomonas sp. KNUC1026 TaxID=2893890 RepID=UPI001F327E81|nr:endolytic transglycosylase MltG [Pseudomonas sp. KNUC1026]UFH48494.1 endolytic transglycosylase MltG [Pseudomonas sp. KNUC1026]
MIRKLLMVLEGILLLAALALGGAAWKVKSSVDQPLQLGAEQLIDVPAGASPVGMFRRLESSGTLGDAFWLRWYWRFNSNGLTLHTGEYRLTPGMTVRDLIGLWQRGEVVQYNLTLVEGWTFRQVRTALAKQEKLKQTLAGLSDEQVMEKLGHPAVFPEGRFFPDTYRYVKGTSDLELLGQAYDRLDAVLAQEWQNRANDVPLSDPYQALILASLIEKETGVPQERGEIAGVFVRRLQAGMLLQTDPTVIYGMGERYNGKITRADLKAPSPYNTYLNAGLPPTPIAIVGREALHAALNPASGRSLYFVARGDGSHVFSENLDEHNDAVRQYQLKRRADYRSSPAAQAPAELPGDATPAPEQGEGGKPGEAAEPAAPAEQP